MTTFGLAYWERDPRRTREDALAIQAAGFSWVVIPVSSERMAFDLEGVEEIIQIFKAQGIETRLSPWGVGGVFGGEGLQEALVRPLDACLRWMGYAIALNPDALYWDEPKGEGSAYLDILSGLARYELPQHLYYNPNLAERPGRGTLRGFRSLGIDAYDRTPDEAAFEASRWSTELDRPIHVWVRSFRLAEDESADAGRMILDLWNLGIQDIAVWGYPSRTVSILNNEQPTLVWTYIQEAIDEIREAEGTK